MGNSAGGKTPQNSSISEEIDLQPRTSTLPRPRGPDGRRRRLRDEHGQAAPRNRTVDGDGRSHTRTIDRRPICPDPSRAADEDAHDAPDLRRRWTEKRDGREQNSQATEKKMRDVR
ncbi:hypothetical protein NL676_025075 [Syzygium grande]|nr:hypothetical protein NL676_025075 [Syzygium grande]